MRRGLVLALSLGCVAVTDTPAAVQFVQPVRPIALTASGRADIFIRVRVEPHVDNRWLDVDIYLDELRVGGWGDPLNGSDGPAIYPEFRPHPAILYTGSYRFVARVCKGTKADGPRTVCDRQRAVSEMKFQVCGPSEDAEGLAC